MKKLIVFLLILILILVVRGLYMTTREKEWPNKIIRDHVTNVKPEEVKVLVFDGLIKVINLTKTEEITPFLAGLQQASYPKDPKRGLLTDNNMTIKIILKNGQTIGPFGFSTSRSSHAFSREFAEAWNKTFFQKIPMD